MKVLTVWAAVSCVMTRCHPLIRCLAISPFQRNNTHWCLLSHTVVNNTLLSLATSPFNPAVGYTYLPKGVNTIGTNMYVSLQHQARIKGALNTLEVDVGTNHCMFPPHST